MTNLTLTIHFCDISQSFVSAIKYENTSNNLFMFFILKENMCRFAIFKSKMRITSLIKKHFIPVEYHEFPSNMYSKQMKIDGG
jgi:hypothetical protein